MSETLVVASKIKKYVREKSEMNTSASAIDALSLLIARELDKAIENARNDKRKTVKDRDIITG